LITVAGISPSLDVTYVVDDVRLGQIQRTSEVHRVAGGKSLNLARAAKVLGADVELTGIFCGPTGDWLVAELERCGIKVSRVDGLAETRMCVSISSVATGALTEVYQNAPAVDARVWQAFCLTWEQHAAGRPGWLVISGGTPGGLAPVVLGDLVTQGHRLGLKVAVDTYGALLPAAVAAGPELIKINRYEAAGLLGVPDTCDLMEMAAVIHRTNAAASSAVVLTDGTDGAIGLDDHGRWRVPAQPMVGRFPVGSGDCFLGGLVTALDRDEELTEALRWASAGGTANALLPGPAVFDPEVATLIHDQIQVVDVS